MRWAYRSDIVLAGGAKRIRGGMVSMLAGLNKKSRMLTAIIYNLNIQYLLPIHPKFRDAINCQNVARRPIETATGVQQAFHNNSNVEYFSVYASNSNVT